MYEISHFAGGGSACPLERASIAPRRLVRLFEKRASAATGAPLLGHTLGTSVTRFGGARALGAREGGL